MTKLNLQPLGSRVIVKPIIEDEVSKAGIVLPETADKKKPIKGEILKVGKGKTLENGQTENIEVKVGDKILFEKYGSDEYKLGDQEFLVVDYDKIVAIIK
ncbi:MAG TPA: co-chaperone GroES [Patescibacteria group bacterium]|nr:co-chaperone GroES [Patescibacteria group bacterium]